MLLVTDFGWLFFDSPLSCVERHEAQHDHNPKKQQVFHNKALSKSLGEELEVE